jgi:probable HAF family extracellular repeat protein
MTALPRLRIAGALLLLAACTDSVVDTPTVQAPPASPDFALAVDSLTNLGGVEARGVNTTGMMAGTSYEIDQANHAIRWTAAGVKQVLKPLSGDTVSPEGVGPGDGFGYDVNDAGNVVGFSTNGKWAFRATIWVGTTQQYDLGSLDGTPFSDNYAYAINNNGIVVGNADYHLGYGGRAFRVQLGGTMQNLGVCSGMEGSTANDINDAGVIVGTCTSRTANSKAFVWTSAGGMQLLPFPAGVYVRASAANGINNQGAIVGTITPETVTGTVLPTRAVMWTPNGSGGYTLTDLGWLPGGTFSAAMGISDRGRVVGYSNTGNGQPVRAFAWDPREGMQSLGTAAGHTTSEAYRINSDGVVAGTSGTSSVHNAARWRVSWTPLAPSGLTATPVSGSRIDLAWADSSNEETGFQLERRVRNPDGSWGNYGAVGTLPANTTIAADSGLVSGVTYQYRVRACRTNCSPYAESNEATTLSLPAAPTGIRAAVVPGFAVEIGWNDASGNESYFNLTRRVQNIDGTWSGYSPVVDAPAGTTVHVDSGRVSGKTYQYRLRSCNVVGCSGYVFSPIVTVGPIPAPPSGPVGNVPVANRINLRWNDLSADENRFELSRRRRNADGTWQGYTSLGLLAANTTAAVDSAVQTVYGYQYRLRACNAYGCSAWAEGPVVAVPVGPGPLTVDAPTSANSLTLRWIDRSTDETTFQVGRHQQAANGTWGPYTTIKTVGANSTSYTDNTVVPGTYQYRVRACNASGCSAWRLGGYVTTGEVILPP